MKRVLAGISVVSLLSLAALGSLGSFTGCAAGEPQPHHGPGNAVTVPTATGDIPPASTAPSASSSPKPPAGACASDADCAPVECCHPKTCGLATQKPSCEAVMCTRECRGGTFDCGGGGCLCQAGQCVAQLKPRSFDK